jgi:ureidoglycolate lyase
MSVSDLVVLWAGKPVSVTPLTAEAFKPFGDVIEASHSAQHFTINQGFAERFHKLAHVDLTQDGGQPAISIFKAKARPLPLRLSVLEKHPFGSQAFMPLSGDAYLVVVALGGDTPDMTTLKCFSVTAQQGVNYAKGTWHHPLLALHDGDFWVVDRAGPAGEVNCVEFALDALHLKIN